MKIPYILLGLSGIVLAAVAIDRKVLRRRRPASVEAPNPMDQMSVAPDIVIVEAEIIGLADVDPEALTQMGEAIDPELTQAAHEEIPEQRDRLPVRDKNIP